MYKKNFITIFFFLLLTGCGGNRKSDNLSDTVTVDVRVNYPQKELILQDFMDVEYIALETTDEFLCQGMVLDIGKEIILVRNNRNDGDIFVFDRKGKGLRKFNHMGQGSEEYVNYSLGWVTLDEENNEIFINDRRRIGVYDLYGKFLRSFPKREGANYSSLQNFDREHLICRETTVPIDEKSTESQPYAIISKKDGSMVSDIRIRFKNGINNIVKSSDYDAIMLLDVSQYLHSIIYFHDYWILTEFSSDTVYRLLPDYSLSPFMTRTPSIRSMDPEILITPILLTNRYYFLEAIKKEVQKGVLGGFPRTNLVYDGQEKKIYKYIIYNDDYVTKKTIDPLWTVTKNNEFRQKIEAYELIEANEKGELKGKLKEVAVSLDEDSNPVIMLIKRKQ